jgi:hypothetical protein
MKMANTVYDKYAVEQARRAKEFEEAGGPAPLKVHSFVFDPNHDQPHQLGYAPGFYDMHGNTLIAARDVVPEHPHCEKVFNAGDVIHVTEADSRLLRWLEGHHSFRRARHSDLTTKDRINN